VTSPKRLSTAQRDCLIVKLYLNYEFSKDIVGRTFSKCYLQRKLIIQWRGNAMEMVGVLSFCCKLFSVINVALSNDGFSDWSNASVRLS